MPNENNSTGNEIVSARTFNYLREQVFKAWSNPDLLANWWGPNGFTNTFHEFDFKAGGNWKFTMHSPDGTDYKNESIFKEIIKPERIVFEHLEPVHKFQATVTFHDSGDKTRLTFSMQFESSRECENVRSLIIDANEQNFDRLESVLYKTFTSA